MTAIQVFEETVENGCQLARVRLNDKSQYDSKSFHIKGSKKGWFYVDHFTASAVLQIRNALSEINKKKFESLSLPGIVNLTWKLVK